MEVNKLSFEDAQNTLLYAKDNLSLLIECKSIDLTVRNALTCISNELEIAYEKFNKLSKESK